MNKSSYLKEITSDIVLFETKKLKELLNFVKFLKYQDYIDPTIEILSNEEWYKKTKFGIEEMNKNDVVEWNSLK
jgi:hypothetical protein